MATRKLIGHVPVDSGTLMVGDPCYVLPKDRWTLDEMCEGEDPMDYLTGAMFPGNGEMRPQVDMGLFCVSLTAHGDGRYPVYVELDDAGLPLRLVVDL